MNKYLAQTKYATEHLIDTIEHERRALEKLYGEQHEVERKRDKLIRVSNTIITCLSIVGTVIAIGMYFHKLWPWLTEGGQHWSGITDILHAPGPPSSMLKGAVKYWFLGILATQIMLLIIRALTKHKKAKLKRNYEFVSEKILNLLEEQDGRIESYNCLSAALLQIAKQGISLRYKGLQDCPDGKHLKSETLKNVIWQGRNQSMHYEETPFNKSVERCFANLEADYGPRFRLGDPPHTNRALFIVQELSWRTYKDYLDDMRLLLP